MNASSLKANDAAAYPVYQKLQNVLNEFWSFIIDQGNILFILLSVATSETSADDK